ncbi:hypothetical protein CAOG_07854 [Capsaspora owczarzaki ATCC 30864]|uniref:NOD3 protein n=1 Tax=Capsaspora owczarzaki (strain ATCC 30864) TaxID=595528 RepID=A0A0D2WX91_CAPO3|nr:hypothetical protein CAOG_07854 [Capsaspora owczarzaki ATCC 30864]KJE97750.1 hypothetical protein CAOG_007854 [Capsaspora owczarzaki ATCC 30864]|eukprot:XP_004342939.1 hypothetical protein CAOG_07854 [Capsaspora owczarzaki ATCC 30864]
MLSDQSMTERQRVLYDQVNASESLDLNQEQIGDAGARAIAEALKVNKTLTSLNLGWNQIGSDGAQEIAEALKVNTTLTKLYLESNEIANAGALAIAEALKVNRTLTELYLRDTRIGGAGAQAIAEALRVNTKLTLLDLEVNQIGDTGAQAFAEALKVNTTLSWLLLWQNQIGDAGALAIAEALEGNTMLEYLFLEANQITDVGAQAIAEAPKVNTRLEILYLEVNQIGDTGAQAIADALKVNTTLTSLTLQGNCIGNVGVQAIDEARNVNDTIEVSIDGQMHPLSFSLLPRSASAEDIQSVFRLLISGLQLQDQSASLPALPIEIAERIMDEAYYWQGVQHTNRDCDDEDDDPNRILKVTVPRSITGDSIRVKAIHVLRERLGATTSNVFEIIVRDEQGAVRYEYAAKPTFVDGTIELVTSWPQSHSIVRQMREGWEASVRPSRLSKDVRFAWLYVGYCAFNENQ